MSDINKIHLVGRLGQDPDIRNTASGKKVVNISVATKYKDKTSWHRAVCWGPNADFVSEYLHKGDLIYLDGRMDYREWTDQSDVKRTSAEIVVQQITGLTRIDRAVTERTEPPADYPETDGNKAPADGFDDIPF